MYYGMRKNEKNNMIIGFFKIYGKKIMFFIFIFVI